MTLNCGGLIVDLSTPKVMGILNLTSDSFFDGGRHNTHDNALKHVEQMVKEGADFIDVGAASSKPGSTWIAPEEEQKILIPVFEGLRAAFPKILFSIDTYNSSTAQACLERGAVIINDISAGTYDPEMMVTVGQNRGVFIAMHLRGTPETMQENPTYKNITEELLYFFSKRKQAAYQAGIHDVVIDPGFGFGKTIAHNYDLIRHLTLFKSLECPLLVGVSRKSMIYKVLQTTPKQALNGTTVLHTLSLLSGAHILRVHDVREAKECVALLNMLA